MPVAQTKFSRLPAHQIKLSEVANNKQSRFFIDHKHIR